jgi:drug/metabolite transporter (DMT)-like permease
MSETASLRDMRRGSLAAAAAAACFGVTVPLVQRFGRGVGPWSTAVLLYTGAALAAGVRTSASAEPRDPRMELRRHAARIVTIALLGAAAAPALLAMGLKRLDGASASLLLGFEAVFTVMFSRALYREAITKRLALAVALMLAGGVVLVRPTFAAPRSTAGAGLVLLAVLCWAADSALMRPLSELPWAGVVRAKSLVGVAAALVVAVITRETLPGATSALGLVACGALGYGVGLRLYLAAQQRVGAARTASVFSVAPFFGAVVALALGERGDLTSLACAGALLALGVAVQTTEHPGLKSLKSGAA